MSGEDWTVKSHVSTSLKELESKGLIQRIQSADNKKRIEIVLLEQANQIIEDGIDAQKQFARNVLSGLTEEENTFTDRRHCLADGWHQCCQTGGCILYAHREKMVLIRPVCHCFCDVWNNVL